MAKKITAGELMSELMADPTYLKMRADKDAKLAALGEAWKKEQIPLAKDLELIGWKVDSAWDLVNMPAAYPEAIPVLVEHLKRQYSDRTREGIARALAVPDAASYWPELFYEYQRSPIDSDVKRGLAAALAAIANDKVINELIGALRNPQNGSSRLILLWGLKKLRSTQATDCINDLRDDPTFSKEINSWNKKKKNK